MAVVKIMLGARGGETGGGGVVAERLDGFFTGNLLRMERLVDEIKWRQARILKPARREGGAGRQCALALRHVLFMYRGSINRLHGSCFLHVRCTEGRS